MDGTLFEFVDPFNYRSTAAAVTFSSAENTIKTRLKRAIALAIGLFHHFPEPFDVEERLASLQCPLRDGAVVELRVYNGRGPGPRCRSVAS